MSYFYCCIYNSHIDRAVLTYELARNGKETVQYLGRYPQQQMLWYMEGGRWKQKRKN
jgi:hypothetical protein